MRKQEKPEKKGNRGPQLRDAAEEKLIQTPGALAELEEKDLKDLVHELRVYQIELEMQNEELRRAQFALEESRSKYMDLYDFSPVGYFTFTRKALIEEVNLTGTALLGAQRQKLINGRFRRFVAPGDQDLWDQHIMSVIKLGEKQSSDLVLRRVDGTTFPARLESVRTEGQDETPVVRTVICDITEHKQLKNLLTESEERYRYLFETASDGIVFIEKREGNITHVNQTIEKILGYSLKESIGKKLQDIGVFDIDDFQTIIQTLNETGIVYYKDVQVKTKSDQYIYMDICLVERGKSLQCNIRDVTQRKHAEDAMRESNRRQRAILNNIPDIAWLKDREGRFIAVNDSFGKACGVRPEDLAGKTDLDIWPRELAERYRADDLEVMNSGKRKRVEEPLVETNGTTTWRDTIKTPIYDDTGSIIGTTGIARDTTERKQAEEELRNTLRQLHEAKDMLIRSEKLAAIGQLSAGVAHEILNPVNIMGMKLQLLEMTEALSEKTKDAIRICKNQIKRITKITRDLQQFARVSEKQITSNNINELIEEVIGLMGPRIKVEDVKIDARYQTDLPLIPLDKDRIGQIIINLINNAIDAMKGRPERVLRVSTEFTDKDVVRLSFSDTGTGIPPDILNRIFDPFFTTKESGKSTGLGLSISYGIIQDHNGTIRAENNEWGGASFFIELPIAAYRNEKPASTWEK